MNGYLLIFFLSVFNICNDIWSLTYCLTVHRSRITTIELEKNGKVFELNAGNHSKGEFVQFIIDIVR